MVCRRVEDREANSGGRLLGREEFIVFCDDFDFLIKLIDELGGVAEIRPAEDDDEFVSANAEHGRMHERRADDIR